MTDTSPHDDAASWPQSVLADACAQAGYNPVGARLIKFTNNAVFVLNTAPVVVRIPGSPPVDERADKIVAVAKWLAEHDMPSVRLINGRPQPVFANGRHVTLWHEVPPGGPPPDGHDLGRILRRFHDLPQPPFQLPPWRPIDGIRKRIQTEDVLTSPDHDFLEQQCDELATAIEELDYQLPAGPIHGDSFIGNLIPGQTGPVICDFDSAAIGPREWDLTPVAVGHQRFTYATNYHQQLAATYGTDLLAWPGFSTLRRLRELQLVTSVLPVLRTNTSLTSQWRYRLQTFRDGDLTARWTTYT